MKKSLAIVVVLGLAGLANAFSDNFNQDTAGGVMLGWAVLQTDPNFPYVIFDQGGGDLAVKKTDITSLWDVSAADMGGDMTGTITLSATISCLDTGNFRPGGIGIVDDSGKGVILGFTSVAGTEWDMGVSTTLNSGLDFTSTADTFDVTGLNTTADNTAKLVIDLSTGNYTIFMNDQASTPGTIALPAGMGRVSDVILCDKKLIVFDDINVTPEPATMALLAFGGIGMLRRRRR